MLIYLNTFIGHCLRTIENENNISEAKRKMLDMSREIVSKPSGNVFNLRKKFYEWTFKKPK